MKYLFLFFSIFFITACSETSVEKRSISFYVNDQTAMNETLKNCDPKPSDETLKANCTNAVKAKNKIRRSNKSGIKGVDIKSKV